MDFHLYVDVQYVPFEVVFSVFSDPNHVQILNLMYRKNNNFKIMITHEESVERTKDTLDWRRIVRCIISP